MPPSFRSRVSRFALDRRFRVELDWCIVKDGPRRSSLPITEQNPRLSYNRQDCERRARGAASTGRSLTGA